MKKNLLKAFTVLIICVFTLNMQAQNFGLVKDINLSKDGGPFNFINNLYLGFQNNDFYIYSGANGGFAVCNNVAYFAANDGIHGTELWRSDNTANGTHIVKDINTGSGSSNIQSITVAGNKLYFTASNILYVSDGTAGGTIPVPGVSYTGDQTTCLTPVGNQLYFLTNISRLWKTDGTALGTSLIKDFRNTYPNPDFLGQLTYVNGTLFFTSGYDLMMGPELWKSDGTASGTVMVKDINPGVNGSRPLNLTAANGKLYFSANNGTGIKLWESDGTAGGTQPVPNNNGAIFTQVDNMGNPNITSFTALNNVLYFNAFRANKGHELYKYDLGNPSAGISLVKDIIPGAGSSEPSNLTIVNNMLFFSVSGSAGNQQLWKSDGTTQGTALIKNMGTGASKYFSDFINANGQLLFSYYKPENGAELWSSNGTAAGTVMLKDIYPGNHSSFPTGLTYYKGGISFFSANDGVKGTELWQTDGTKTGTTIVKNINTTTTSGSDPLLLGLPVLNNKLYFSAYDPVYGNGLYISDGTAGGTQLIKDLNPGNSSNPSNFTVFKNSMYFSADSAGYTSIYKTDGTAAGTKQIFNAGKTNTTVSKIVPAKNYIYVFYKNLDSNNVQLWVSNGNGTAGSHKIQDNIAANLITGRSAATIKDTLYFAGFDSAHGEELWKATTAPGSATMIKDIYTGSPSSNLNHFVVLKNKIYFDAVDNANNRFFYMSDGTAAGTQRLCDNSTAETSLIISGGKLIFNAYDSTRGNELFVSNGTKSGTRLLKDIYPGSGNSYPIYLTSMGSVCYFRANDGVYGTELWKSDGTAKGTVLVKDIVAGANGSYPYQFTVAGGKLYFMGQNDSFQNVLYVSNGTDGGTNEVNDAGLAGVNINTFIGGGDKLFINGFTNASGNELYAGAVQGFVPDIGGDPENAIAKNQTFKAVILGNPVQNELRLLINAGKQQKSGVVITDASGKVLINKNEYLNAGTNMIQYSTASLLSGVYTLKISAADGSSTLLKFVK